MTTKEKKQEVARKLAKDRGPEFCEERASKGGQAAIQKYGIEIYKIMAAKRWAK